MSENEQNVPLFPLDNKGEPMKTFEVKMRKRSDGTIEKAIFIDGKVIDWSVDISSLMEAYRMGPKYARAAQKDIGKHFVESVSEVLGRKVTTQDIKRATSTGWI
jgi:hypothetical protein